MKCDNPPLDETRRYTKANWKKGANLFRKKENEDVKRFFKKLKLEYKFQLAQQFDELPVSEYFLYDDVFVSDNPTFPHSDTRKKTNWNLLKFVQDEGSSLKDKLLAGIVNILKK